MDHFVRHARSLALILIASLTTIGIAHAEKRIALIVGNSNYQSITRLDNPKNDATLMAQPWPVNLASSTTPSNSPLS